MSRKISMGTNSQYIERADTVNQYNSIVRANSFPETLTDAQWTEFLSFINQFLLSKEAETLSVANYKKIHEELSMAQESYSISGWERFRNFLEDTANAATIITPIVTFIAANSNQIAQWIQMIF